MLNDEERNHITEKAIDDFEDFDYILENEGLDSLKNTAHFIARNDEEASKFE